MQRYGNFFILSKDGKYAHGYRMNFFASAEICPFRGVLIQSLGAKFYRTAVEMTSTFTTPDYAALIWG